MANNWDKYKNEIVSLYLIEGLTLSEVSAQMAQKHGFEKEKHQYEYVLKKWKISKNTKRGMWEYVNHVVQKRQKQNKESQVQMYGVRLSDARVKKAMQRYGRISLAEKFGTAASPKSPGNGLVSINSPPAPEGDIELPEDGPWVDFDRKFHMSHLQLSEPLMYSMVRTLATCSMNHEDLAFAPDNIAISTVLHESLDWAATLARMQPQLHDNSPGSVSLAHARQPGVTASRVLKTLLFHMSNKRVSVAHPLLAHNMVRLIYGLCQEFAPAIDHLIRASDPTSAAIKEIFFDAAVRCGQASLVSRFLANGANPNVLIDHRLEFRKELHRGKAVFIRHSHIRFVTPLQLVSAACWTEMAIVLLEGAANPNLGNPSPLQIVCSLPPTPNSLRLAKLFFQYGARIDNTQNDILLPPLMEAVACGNTKAVQLLLDHNAADRVVSMEGLRHYENISPSYLHINLPDGSNHPSRFATRFLLYEFTRTITALQISVLVEDIHVVELLIRAISGQRHQMDIYKRGLVTACLAAQEDTVRRLLDVSPAIRDDQVFINSAFCAIAWKMDCRIAHMLISYGALPRWNKRFRMSAIQAAALYGNVDLINLLHFLGYDINSPATDPQHEPITYGPTGDNLYRWRPLECAIRMCYGQTAQLLLQLGAPVMGQTVSIAIMYGEDELVLTLLAKGPDLTKMHANMLPLQIAVEKQKDLALIKKLIDAGAQFSGNELATAIKTGNHDVSQYLLCSGVNVLGSAATGENILEVAAEAGDLPIIQKYIQCGGHYTSKALFLAVEEATLTAVYSTVEYLFQCRPSTPMDTYEASSLVRSILENDCTLVDMFLKISLCHAISFFCWHEEWDYLSRPLCISSQLGFTRSNTRTGTCPLVQCSQRISPLWAAAHLQQDSLMKDLILREHSPHAFLLESALYNQRFANQDVRQQIITAYPLSSIKDTRECQRLLMAAIDWKADADLVQHHAKQLRSLDFYFSKNTVRHWTPLQFAAARGNIECARALLNAGANINTPISGSLGAFTALQAAIEYEHLDMIMFLLENGADVNASVEFKIGGTALQLAVGKGDHKVTRLLLDHGADVHGPPSACHGSTAIEIAAKLGLIDMVALLLPHLRFDGHMRLHFVRAVGRAEQNCHYATEEYLKNGRWTEEDRKLWSRVQSNSGGPSCSRFFFNDVERTGECSYCGELSDTSSIYADSVQDRNTVLSVADSMDADAQAAGCGPVVLADHGTRLEDRFEYLVDDQVLDATETSSVLDNSTSQWLDTLVKDYFESLENYGDEA